MLRTKVGEKFESKSNKLVFVGYTQAGYRLLDKSKNKILVSCDVVFNENSVGEIVNRVFEVRIPLEKLTLIISRI